MEDKELTERAAKAAGAEIIGYRGKEPLYGMPAETEEGTEYSRWDPLTDDGDALRLAVALDISIQQDDESPFVWVYYPHPGRINRDRDCEPHGDDKCAATRRAIVRAAAEMAGE